MTNSPRRIILLGSTGSIGTQTIEVLANLARCGSLVAPRAERCAAGVPRYEIVGLAAGSNAALLFEQARALGVKHLALANGASGGASDAPPGCVVRTGPDAAERLVREVACDVVLGAMVGAAGVPAVLAALELGRDVALANKESLVCAGAIVTAAAQRTGARLLPVDSEHSGVWQCLAARRAGEFSAPPFAVGSDVRKIVLTASGGALRQMPRENLYSATPAQALAHPTWSMGAKVTIDSASLMNKALELVEAHWLFGVESSRLGAIIHPQSIVHSFVEFADRSTIAQMGVPDMRTPIQYALTWPDRPAGLSPAMPFGDLRSLTFEPVDPERYPALGLGFRVIDLGGTAGAVLNGANERAVELFLGGAIPFGRIAELVGRALDEVGVSPLRTLGDAMQADAEGRRSVSAAAGAVGCSTERATDLSGATDRGSERSVHEAPPTSNRPRL